MWLGKGVFTIHKDLFEAYQGVWYIVLVKSFGCHMSEVAVRPAELIIVAPNYRLSYLNYFVPLSDLCYRGG